MEVEKYRRIIKQSIEKQTGGDREDLEVESQIAFDLERDRYFLLQVGWRGEKRVYGCVLHLEIKAGKIWIQRDGTERGVATALIEAGVPKSDLVLGYRSPYMRQFTELAVG